MALTVIRLLRFDRSPVFYTQHVKPAPSTTPPIKDGNPIEEPAPTTRSPVSRVAYFVAFRIVRKSIID